MQAVLLLRATLSLTPISYVRESDISDRLPTSLQVEQSLLLISHPIDSYAW